MAVYTEVSADQLASALATYNLILEGSPSAVTDGIENTTYFFRAMTETGKVREYVLTLIESCPPSQVAYTTALTRHLAAQGLPVPCPLKTADGTSEGRLNGRPALIFPKARGHHLASPTATDCAAIGDFLARLHLSSGQFAPVLDNTRGLPWLQDACSRLIPALDFDALSLIERNIESYQGIFESAQTLPRGAIHGDLFRDNALFYNNSLSAVIDFYNACSDWLLLDVAITMNDWCVNWPEGSYDATKTEQFLLAYETIRPLTPNEREHWHAVLTIAANRFWVSRLLDAHSGRAEGETTKMKDPNEFLRLLHTIATDAPQLAR